MKARVIDTVGVRDQRVGQGAQIKELIPVSISPGQTLHLDPEHDPDLAQPDIRHQPLKPLPTLSALS